MNAAQKISKKTGMKQTSETVKAAAKRSEDIEQKNRAKAAKAARLTSTYRSDDDFYRACRKVSRARSLKSVFDACGVILVTTGDPFSPFDVKVAAAAHPSVVEKALDLDDVEANMKISYPKEQFRSVKETLTRRAIVNRVEVRKESREDAVKGVLEASRKGGGGSTEKVEFNGKGRSLAWLTKRREQLNKRAQRARVNLAEAIEAVHEVDAAIAAFPKG